jgi:hypothetical protein
MSAEPVGPLATGLDVLAVTPVDVGVFERNSADMGDHGHVASPAERRACSLVAAIFS